MLIECPYCGLVYDPNEDAYGTCPACDPFPFRDNDGNLIMIDEIDYPEPQG